MLDLDVFDLDTFKDIKQKLLENKLEREDVLKLVEIIDSIEEYIDDLEDYVVEEYQLNQEESDI